MTDGGVRLGYSSTEKQKAGQRISATLRKRRHGPAKYTSQIRTDYQNHPRSEWINQLGDRWPHQMIDLSIIRIDQSINRSFRYSFIRLIHSVTYLFSIDQWSKLLRTIINRSFNWNILQAPILGGTPLSTIITCRSVGLKRISAAAQLIRDGVAVWG